MLPATRDSGKGLLDLLLLLDRHGVEPVRHGEFIGYRNVRRLTPDLQRLADEQEDALRRHLPDTPTPFKARQRRQEAKAR
jgi:hypothetical protein